MTTFQFIFLSYALLVFLIKGILHALGVFAGGKVSSYTQGHLGNFIAATLDWSVIFALIGVLF